MPDMPNPFEFAGSCPADTAAVSPVSSQVDAAAELFPRGFDVEAFLQAIAPEIEPLPMPPDIVLDLPAPPSVNRTRRMDWSAVKIINAWKSVANAYVLAAKGRTNSPLKLAKVPKFELHILLSEHHTKIDLDNGLKVLIDYLRKIELIEDDSPKHLRRLVVEWGAAPFGCRVTVKALA